jgi:phosphotransferase system HPr (HPr) family protein
VTILDKKIFVYISKKTLCFREAAKIMKIHDKYNTRIEIIADGKEASTDSILSLTRLGATEGSRMIIVAFGDKADDAIRSVISII